MPEDLQQAGQNDGGWENQVAPLPDTDDTSAFNLAATAGLGPYTAGT